MDADAYRIRTFRAPVGGVAVEHPVHERLLDGGPAVVLLQELPGIGPETLRLADALSGAGFSVVIPRLFGPFGARRLGRNVVRVFCLRREFRLFAARASSPVVDWLRALCRDARGRDGARGVGVIGMCLTGNFAISLMADDAVLAGVAAQPSLPLHRQGALHMSDREVRGVRAALDHKGSMLAFRFDGDHICGRGRFEALDRAFNDDAERICLHTLPGTGHSVLTLHFVDEAGHPTRAALDTVLAYFDERLR